ncbi:hypothetical protein [Palleronia sp.]|uniref:hypothetical protein n=1 Tax=Palleronia sp. TaxID=1940284 RepID=UPI0035C81031
MKHARALGTALLLSLTLPGALSAQTATAGTRLSDAPPPAEFPPASFTRREYVDSAGCLYVRGGEGATSIWVPRVTANRRVICGLKPTLARTAESEAPVIADTAASRVAPMAPVPAAAPVSAGRYTPPTVTHRITPRPYEGGATQLRPVAQVPRAMPQVAVAPEMLPLISVYEAGQRAVAGTLDVGTVIAVPAPPAPIAVPEGYRPAWNDGRLNPYAGKQLLSGALQQALVWTQTVPRRLKTNAGADVTSRYNYLVYPFTDYASQTAALGSGNYVIIETTAGREIVPRY